MAQLWGGRFTKETDQLVYNFNASISFDKRFYEQDIRGSIAHVTMLAKQGILTEDEKKQIIDGLNGIREDVENGTLEITDKYEDIQCVELLLKHRYESYGTPIARDWYVLDYRFEFKDGNHFYFYWPITLDDDARFIGMILDEKVENVIDKDHVIEALKNGIHLNDYMKKTED